LNQVSAVSLSDNLAHWLCAQYTVAARRALDASDSGSIDLKTLRTLSADVVALRRGDHCAGRLKLELDRLELDRKQAIERTDAFCIEWAQRPENYGKFLKADISDEEKARRIREIYGLPEKPGLSSETLADIEREAKLL